MFQFYCNLRTAITQIGYIVAKMHSCAHKKYLLVTLKGEVPHAALCTDVGSNDCCLTNEWKAPDYEFGSILSMLEAIAVLREYSQQVTCTKEVFMSVTEMVLQTVTAMIFGL